MSFPSVSFIEACVHPYTTTIHSWCGKQNNLSRSAKDVIFLLFFSSTASVGFQSLYIISVQLATAGLSGQVGRQSGCHVRVLLLRVRTYVRTYVRSKDSFKKRRKKPFTLGYTKERQLEFNTTYVRIHVHVDLCSHEDKQLSVVELLAGAQKT